MRTGNLTSFRGSLVGLAALSLSACNHYLSHFQTVTQAQSSTTPEPNTTTATHLDSPPPIPQMRLRSQPLEAKPTPWQVEPRRFWPSKSHQNFHSIFDGILTPNMLPKASQHGAQINKQMYQLSSSFSYCSFFCFGWLFG